MNPPKRLRTSKNEAETPTGGQEEEDAVDVVGGRLALSHTLLTLIQRRIYSRRMWHMKSKSVK